jgi:kynurenine formamidase
MRVIDLSHTIHDGIQIFPGDPVPSVKRGLTHENDYCHVDVLTLGSHTGTHIDAPFHFLKKGKKINEFPVQRFVGDGAREANTWIAREMRKPYDYSFI